MNNSVTIFGSKYSLEELELLCNQKVDNPDTEKWEKEIYVFFRQWFSESDSITAETSGSTSKPKTIKLRKEHIIASAQKTLGYFDLSKDNTAWLCLPVHYIAGKLMIVRAIVGELNLIYSKPEVLPMIDYSEKIDFVAMVPNQVSNLIASDKGISILEDVGKLLIGGSEIPSILEQNIKMISNICAWNSYGMTETITHIALRKIGENELDGDFIPLPGVELTVNNENQLIISSASIGVVDLLTNDIVDLFDDGSFSILGRKDNVVISGGLKLFPEVIENIIKEFVDAELFVGGLPDDSLGQKLTLFIEGNTFNLTNTELRERLLLRLKKHQIPKEIKYVDSFIRTPNGKLQRDEILKMVILDKNLDIS